MQKLADKYKNQIDNNSNVKKKIKIKNNCLK